MFGKAKSTSSTLTWNEVLLHLIEELENEWVGRTDMLPDERIVQRGDVVTDAFRAKTALLDSDLAERAYKMLLASTMGNRRNRRTRHHNCIRVIVAIEHSNPLPLFLPATDDTRPYHPFMSENEQ